MSSDAFSARFNFACARAVCFSACFVLRAAFPARPFASAFAAFVDAFAASTVERCASRVNFCFGDNRDNFPYVNGSAAKSNANPATPATT